MYSVIRAITARRWINLSLRCLRVALSRAPTPTLVTVIGNDGVRRGARSPGSRMKVRSYSHAIRASKSYTRVMGNDGILKSLLGRFLRDTPRLFRLPANQRSAGYGGHMTKGRAGSNSHLTVAQSADRRTAARSTHRPALAQPDRARDAGRRDWRRSRTSRVGL